MLEIGGRVMWLCHCICNTSSVCLYKQRLSHSLDGFSLSSSIYSCFNPYISSILASSITRPPVTWPKSQHPGRPASRGDSMAPQIWIVEPSRWGNSASRRLYIGRPISLRESHGIDKPLELTPIQERVWVSEIVLCDRVWIGLIYLLNNLVKKIFIVSYI